MVSPCELAPANFAGVQIPAPDAVSRPLSVSTDAHAAAAPEGHDAAFGLAHRGAAFRPAARLLRVRLCDPPSRCTGRPARAATGGHRAVGGLRRTPAGFGVSLARGGRRQAGSPAAVSRTALAGSSATNL